MVHTIRIGVGMGECSTSASRKGMGTLTRRRDPGEAEGARKGSVTPGLPGHDWTIPLCRGVGGIERDIAFEGASAQGAFCWVAPGVSPGSHLRLSVASINHRTIKKLRNKAEFSYRGARKCGTVTK